MARQAAYWKSNQRERRMRFGCENVNSSADKLAILFHRKVDEMWPIDLLLPLARHVISELRHVRESSRGRSEKTSRCVG
jgi:hypothetical protein